MDRMQTKFIIAVTGRLSAAADTTARTEVIEELSENLYRRYLDLTAQGVAEEEAYQRAMEDLGDVDELLEYLRSLSPDQELPRQEQESGDFFSDLCRNLEEIARETVSQTKDAVDSAKVLVKDVTRKLKEKYPEGFPKTVGIHFEGDASKAPGENGGAPENGDRIYGFGYDKTKGGFFAQWGEWKGTAIPCENGMAFPSDNLQSIAVKLHNGDVTIHLAEEEGAPVTVDGDADQFEVRVSDGGLLSLCQGNTASSSFFFGRGLASADLELTIPRRYWDAVQLSTTNGDVTLDSGLHTGSLSIRTLSGDIRFDHAACPQMTCKSASGDIHCHNLTGTISAESASGDVKLNGCFDQARLSSISGDVALSGSIASARCSCASGDVDIESDALPQQLEVSVRSGDCSLCLPVEKGFVVEYRTVSGQLRSDLPITSPTQGRSGTAVYLDGGEQTYHISSVSGDIRLTGQKSTDKEKTNG